MGEVTLSKRASFIFYDNSSTPAYICAFENKISTPAYICAFVNKISTPAYICAFVNKISTPDYICVTANKISSRPWLIYIRNTVYTVTYKSCSCGRSVWPVVRSSADHSSTSAEFSKTSTECGKQQCVPCIIMCLTVIALIIE